MQAVIFDLYETLITEFDPNWKDPEFWKYLGLSKEQWRYYWLKFHDTRMKGEIPDYPSVLREICRSSGVNADEVVIQELYQQRLRAKERLFQRVDPAVVRMIGMLSKKGMRITVLSDVAVEEVAAWPNSVLAEMIDYPVFSFQVGLMKPDPKIYRLACQRVESAPENTVFIGDGGSRELFGAKRVGLTPVWATWFLEKWPEWRMDYVDPFALECLRCKHPDDVVQFIQKFSSNC